MRSRNYIGSLAKPLNLGLSAAELEFRQNVLTSLRDGRILSNQKEGTSSYAIPDLPARRMLERLLPPRLLRKDL